MEIKISPLSKNSAFGTRVYHNLSGLPQFGSSNSQSCVRVIPMKLGLRKKNWRVVQNSGIDVERSGNSSTNTENYDRTSSMKPVYMPTPSDRDLRTPHSGYHFDGSMRKFFEGWYFRVTIPEKKQSFCFMYSIENPAFPNKLGALDETLYGPRYTGVGAQILGADDKYICQFSNESKNFWGSRHELALGNTFVERKNQLPPSSEVPPQDFDRRVLEGFQVTPIWHQGFIRDNGRTPYVKGVKSAGWKYSTRPVYGWGNIGSKQKASAGWAAAFPVFEPHWQICMAGGLSTGWIDWDGELFEFVNAPSYSEKNWGGGFPRKWFWVQCNVFQGASGEIALTAGGGLRKLTGLSDNYEEVALIGVHYGGTFYEFVPWTSNVNWEITPWGSWFMFAENDKYKVELVATTKEQGTPLRAPTAESGLVVACKDTCFGDLKLKIWEKRSHGSEGKVILDVTSDLAALEVGGGPWFNTWKGTCTSPDLISQALRVPVELDTVFNFLPFLKPPGL